MPAEKLDVVQYFRITPTNAKYLREICDETGVPMSRIADTIIEHARTQGWRIATKLTKVVENEPQAHGITQQDSLWEEHLRDEP